MLVQEVLDSGAKVSLFTRPRRFGNPLAMITLRTFFEDERDVSGEKIDNSRIMKWHTVRCETRFRMSLEGIFMFGECMVCRFL